MATIQIADNDARVQYTQAVTADVTQLTIDFPFFALDDINVIVTNAAGTDTVLSRGTGTGTFAVNGTAVDDGFSGGNVTLGDDYVILQRLLYSVIYQSLGQLTSQHQVPSTYHL